MNRNGQERHKLFTYIGDRAGTLAERVCRTKFQSSFLNIYFRVNGFECLLLIIYFCMSQNLVSNVGRSTFEIGAAQLCYVTEIAPKSPFLCVNRSPNRYGFQGGAKTIRHNVNIALVTVPTHNVIFRCKDLSLEAGWKPTDLIRPTVFNRGKSPTVLDVVSHNQRTERQKIETK